MMGQVIAISKSMQTKCSLMDLLIAKCHVKSEKTKSGSSGVVIYLSVQR